MLRGKMEEGVVVLPRSQRAWPVAEAGTWAAGRNRSGVFLRQFCRKRNNRRQVRRPSKDEKLGRFLALAMGLASVLDSFSLQREPHQQH
jgi:hypothetical protein